MIPLSVPNFEGNELKYVTDAVGQGWVSTGGAYIGKLEEMTAGFLHTEKTVACQSGSAALHLALMECGVQYGELVIAPTLTFIAAVNPIRYIGADAVFMDCDDSLCIDPAKLRKFCKEECKVENNLLVHRKTGKIIRALIVVHVFGNMADMEEIMDIADNFHLKVVEDATEALGTKYTEGKYAGRYAGTIGDFGAYSFNGNKIITTGGGGMVTSTDLDQLDHIRYLSTQAKDDALFYVHNEVGYNYRMTNIQAAVGAAQMELLPEFIIRKNNNYAQYGEFLKNIENVELLPFRDGVRSNKWFYAVRIKGSRANIRELVGRMLENGIQTRLIWGLIHKQKPYMDSICYEIEKAEEYAGCILNVPCSTNLKKEDIKAVCSALEKCIL